MADGWCLNGDLFVFIYIFILRGYRDVHQQHFLYIRYCHFDVAMVDGNRCQLRRLPGIASFVNWLFLVSINR